MFPLIETIKVLNGELQNLKWHQNRFEASYFKYFKQLTNIKLAEVITVPEEHQDGVVKLRFLYNETDCFCQFDAYEPRKINTFQLVAKNDLDYSIKLVDRKILDDLRKNAGADEIIIIKNARVTDTTFSNLAFFNGKEWHTPKFPLLRGTARARLIAEKKLIQKDIFIDDLTKYQSFKLINAMLDWDAAEVYDIGVLG